MRLSKCSASLKRSSRAAYQRRDADYSCREQYVPKYGILHNELRSENFELYMQFNSPNAANFACFFSRQFEKGLRPST